jgi:3-dehydroquinate synthase
MSDLKATVVETKSPSGHFGFHVEGHENIEYDFTFIDRVLNIQTTPLVACFNFWNRCLAITDLNIYNIYGKQIRAYFEHCGIELKIHKTRIGEKAKTIPNLLSL